MRGISFSTPFLDEVDLLVFELDLVLEELVLTEPLDADLLLEVSDLDTFAEGCEAMYFFTSTLLPLLSLTETISPFLSLVTVLPSLSLVTFVPPAEASEVVLETAEVFFVTLPPAQPQDDRITADTTVPISRAIVLFFIYSRINTATASLFELKNV